MPRSLRIEKENGVYHIINRGNYRQDLFISDGAHQSFERCLFEACVKCGWVLESYCVMRERRGHVVFFVVEVDAGYLCV